MEVKTSSSFVEARKLPRIEVRWPVTLMMENGSVKGEIKNISAEGVYIQFKHSFEEMPTNVAYRLLIHPPGEQIIVSGKLVWSNLDILPEMGFCFLEFSEGDRELLIEAIQKYAGE